MCEYKSDFNRSIERLKEVKQEFRQLKADYEAEKAIMKKEPNAADALKFTQIKKKSSFLPALKSKGFLQDT